MKTCPECGIEHISKKAAYSCLGKAAFDRVYLATIGEEETKEREKADERDRKMRMYYYELPNLTKILIRGGKK